MGVTPFESARRNLDHAFLGLCESIALDAAVKAAVKEEAAMASLGNGVPPLSETVMIHMMWSQIGEMSIPGEH